MTITAKITFTPAGGDPSTQSTKLITRSTSAMLLLEEDDLAQTAVDRLALLVGQLKALEPVPSGAAEQIADGGLCDQLPDQR